MAFRKLELALAKINGQGIQLGWHMQVSWWSQCWIISVQTNCWCWIKCWLMIAGWADPSLWWLESVWKHTNCIWVAKQTQKIIGKELKEKLPVSTIKAIATKPCISDVMPTCKLQWDASALSRSCLARWECTIYGCTCCDMAVVKLLFGAICLLDVSILMLCPMQACGIWSASKKKHVYHVSCVFIPRLWTNGYKWCKKCRIGSTGWSRRITTGCDTP